MTFNMETGRGGEVSTSLQPALLHATITTCKSERDEAWERRAPSSGGGWWRVGGRGGGCGW